MRALILSWEYPPIVEGGLARHVRKLSEGLVREGVEAHVLTRGGARSRHTGGADSPPRSTLRARGGRFARRADRVIVCSHYMRGHVADVFGLDEERVAVIPNGIDPTDLQPMADLDALRARFAAPEERLVLLVGRLVYEKGFQLALDAPPGVIDPVGGGPFLRAARRPPE